MMRIEQFAALVADLAKHHPNADVAIAYPARHAGKPTTRRGKITGHRTFIPSHPVVRPTIWIEIEHARSTSVSDQVED